MTVKGRVHNGVVVLDEQLLPEGSEVLCTIVLRNSVETPEPEPQPFANLMQFAGMFTGTPRDGSENHDKYIYGQEDK